MKKDEKDELLMIIIPLRLAERAPRIGELPHLS